MNDDPFANSHLMNRSQDGGALLKDDDVFMYEASAAPVDRDKNPFVPGIKSNLGTGIEGELISELPGVPPVYTPQPQSMEMSFLERYLGFMHPAYWRVKNILTRNTSIMIKISLDKEFLHQSSRSMVD